MIAPAAGPSFEERAGGRLLRDPPGRDGSRADLKGDHALDLGDVPLDLEGTPLDLEKARPAGVLVPVVQHPGGPTVLLTQRAATLRQHSGQIAFPGGRRDPEDATIVDTALREAEEEIGLDRSHVRPLGFLDAYLSGTNFLVIPTVALVRPGFTLTLNPHEVDSAFEVPLDFLMEEANHQLHAREWQGRTRRYYAMPFGDRYIWGVTAGILRNMYERLYRP